MSSVHLNAEVLDATGGCNASRKPHCVSVQVLEYEVSKGRIAADDVAIFSDGHDVLLQQPLTEILKAYSRFPDSSEASVPLAQSK